MEYLMSVPQVIAAAGGARLIPPMYDLAFGLVAALIVVATIFAIVVVARSRLDATQKVLLVAVTLVAPLIGGVAAVLVVLIERKRSLT